jgi:SAM-dependent methyltransferase
MPSQTAETVLSEEETGGLGGFRFAHPDGTFALTPASRISLQAIFNHQALLHGVGLDWGCGTGCLAIAAARIARVEYVLGLDLAPANVAVARENAHRNAVEAKCVFLHSDSYSPVDPEDRAVLSALAGRVDFLLANPPSSEGDDGFGFRRVVLRGARAFLRPGGVVFLSISSQYGRPRIGRLGEEVPGFRAGGILATTGLVPFDLTRPDLLHCLELYAAEERRGGWPYDFCHAEDEVSRTAEQALADFRQTGRSPRMCWQTHEYRAVP